MSQKRDFIYRHILDTRRQIGALLGRLDVQSPRDALVFAACLLCGWAASSAALSFGDLSQQAARALFILVAAALLWVTEAAPAFAVGILVIALQVMLLAPLDVAGSAVDHTWQNYVGVLGHPLIWLFFGGFVLAAATAHTGLDRLLAIAMLSQFGTRPAALLAGVMTVTFGFSMFMSNTATTALMLALLSPVLHGLQSADPFRKALLLGTAVAANIGGMGSLIGTPPNAIAAGALAKLPGESIGFLGWVGFGLPPATLLSIIAWVYLGRRYPALQATINLRQLLVEDAAIPQAPRWQRGVVTVTGLSTVALWILDAAPSAVVSLLPIVVFTTSNVLGPTAIRKLPWDVLFLLAGGLALGDAVRDTGLAAWMVQGLPTSWLSASGLALGISYLCVALSNLMSNTAAANVLVPIAVSVSSGFESQVVLPLALSASAAMCLPIATPPNALVFASGELKTADFLRPGLLVGALAPLLATAWASLFF